MTRIGILSDTHSTLDERVLPYFADCDEIWHAGDIGDVSVLNALEDSGKIIRAVSGNADAGDIRCRCPEVLIFEVEGVKVLMTHIGGYPGRWAPGMKKLLRENNIKLMVDGHSHILKVIYDHELALLHINPGAAGNMGWHKVRTLIRLDIDNAEMKNCEVIEFGTRR